MLAAALSLSVGQLLPWVGLAAAIAASWRFLIRGGGGTAIASLEAANRILDQRVHELEAEDHRKTKRIAELEARTDISLAIVPVLDALRVHEVEAAKRSEATLGVLDLIAQRLGPDTTH